MEEALTDAKLREINKTRKHHGLPEMVITKRVCLCCPKKFSSEGSHNRLCPACCRNKKED